MAAPINPMGQGQIYNFENYTTPALVELSDRLTHEVNNVMQTLQGNMNAGADSISIPDLANVQAKMNECTAVSEELSKRIARTGFDK